MTERNQALSLAVALHAGNPEGVLATAAGFLAFLMGDSPRIVTQDQAAQIIAQTAVPTVTPGKPRGRPVRGESAPTAAAPSAPAPAPVASPATTAPPTGVALPAATPAAAGTASITYASLAPTFLAAAKTHKREFVVKCMAKFGATQFDKVPADKLPDFKAMLEAGPQPETNANDVADLMG